MALLDKGLKQRIVGALVLLALAVIFLPMLLSREDEQHVVRVDAPPMPEPVAMPVIEPEPVAVPEPLAEDPVLAASYQAVTPEVSSLPVAPVVEAPAKPVAPPVQVSANPLPRLDSSSLPVSWSVQLASLSNRANAQKLQDSLRAQGYNAYLRQVDGMNRVFVGPLIERAEAERVRDQINRKQKLSGIVVRFQPERS